MYGVWFNALTVIIGGITGCALRGGIPAKFRSTINYGLALCVMVIGISGAIETQNVMGVIVSVIIGSILGEALRIDDGLERIGQFAQSKFSGSDDSFSQGFVSATLLFCVGAMAVVGSLDAGISGNGDTLMAKSVLDGVSAAIFASTLGPGVILSAAPMTLYQGGIALLASQIEPYLTDYMVVELSAVGSVLIIGLSLNMLDILKQRIRVANMLPAMVVIIAYIPLADWLKSLF
ncbi:MAG: DUF554 domain-containing protein [Clostridia bacterium]|nr:DUF554 domain-containing protein [Clostridia bacterium]